MLLAAVLVVTGCAGVDVRSKPGTTTTIVMLRHADRDTQQLNEIGRARARMLVDAVGHMGVTAIYSPDIDRNLDTVRPLAEHLGIAITITPRFSAFEVDRIASDILERHAGGVVVWVGNVTGNLQAMYRRFGGRGRGPLEYGDLFILTIPDSGAVTVVKTRFGPDVTAPE